MPCWGSHLLVADNPLWRVTPGGLAHEPGRSRVGSFLTFLSVLGTLYCMEPGKGINWLAQVRRGVAEHCVLALLTSGERYGFELARELGARGQIIASEGTLYPRLPGCDATASSRLRGRSQTPARRAATTTNKRRRTSPRQLQETVADFPRCRQRDPRRREPGVTTRQTASEADKLVRRYLAQLDAALQGVEASGGRRSSPTCTSTSKRGGPGSIPTTQPVSGPSCTESATRCHRRRGGRTPPGSRRWDAWAPWLIIFASSRAGWAGSPEC